MKQRYGSQGCYLLKINSRTAAAGTDEQIPDPWSQYLNKSSLQSQDQSEEPAPTPVVVNNTAVENNIGGAPHMDGAPEMDGHDSAENGELSHLEILKS
ncbi:unnamed protein product [Oncorhynchus mykiss]|uniref:Uncharacterized protein n=1 Tax=Oncorhynchus mykiss TaxID=8022 RepID=A0A060Z1K8_ONCMY|nr:unnamed protein product [Oncorhynchus mykiss]